MNFPDYFASPDAPLKPSGALFYEATPADNTAPISNEISTYSFRIDSILLGNELNSNPTLASMASTASSGFPLLTVVVVIAIAIVAVVAALLLIRKRHEAPPSPTPPPPPETTEQ